MFGFQIQSGGFLARILRQIADAHACSVARRVCAQHTGKIPRAWALHFDDLGAHKCQLIAAIGAGQHVCQVKDPNAFQRFSHLRPPLHGGLWRGVHGSWE